jgi:hypothetical protein
MNQFRLAFLISFPEPPPKKGECGSQPQMMTLVTHFLEETACQKAIQNHLRSTIF